jgi:hypothetical protein
VLRQFNAAAEEHFYKSTHRRLSDHLDPDDPECLGTILGTIPPPLTRWCGIARADAAARSGQSHEPIAAGLAYTAGGADRTRELFLVYARLTAAGDSAVRMLPFPSVWQLHIHDEGTTKHRFGSLVARVPVGITVSVPELLPPTTHTVDELQNDGLWETLEGIGEFYQRVQRNLTLDSSPAVAWDRALADYSRTATGPGLLTSSIPEAVRRVFAHGSQCSPADAQGILTRMWAHPLDAPTLTTYVYPRVLQRLRDDQDFKLTPRGSAADRDRYFRLQIPIEELEAQDHYLGWLPTAKPYRDERPAVRDALYGSK